MVFPHSLVGTESACNAGDSSLIPRSGRSPREGIGYPLQYSWASLVAQMVKILSAMQDTWVWFLGWEDPLENGKATRFCILAWRCFGLQRVGHDLLAFTFTVIWYLFYSRTLLYIDKKASWFYYWVVFSILLRHNLIFFATFMEATKISINLYLSAFMNIFHLGVFAEMKLFGHNICSALLYIAK